VPKPLVSTLVALQLKLMWRQLRASTSMMVGSIVMLVMVLGAAIPAMWGLVALRGASLEARGAITVIAFGVLTLGWPIAVTLMTGNNDMLDAGRFALYPVRARQLLPGLLVAAATGLGGLLTLVLGIGFVAAWSSSLATAVLAVFGLVMGFATCLVSSRALSAALAAVLRRRRARDLVTIVVVIVILALSTGIQFITHALPGNVAGNSGTLDLSQMWQQFVTSIQPTANAIAWTPFGWAWALPWAAGQGDWGHAAIWGVLAIAWLAFLAWAWMRYFSASLTSPLEAGGTSQKIAKANPLDRLLPATPAGAVAKRGLRYWRRDPRRLVGAIATLVMPIMMGVAVYASGNNPDTPGDIINAVLAFSPAMVGFMAAIGLGYDISYDGTALGTQIVTGISGRDDRWGRAMAYLVIFVPVQVVMIVAFLAVSGRWDLAIPVAGLSFAWLLSGAGVGSWMGAMWQIPQPPAGSNLVNRSGSGGVAGFLSAMLGIFLPFVVCLPVLALAITAVVLGGWWSWATLGAGLAIGAFVLWLGMRIGGRHLDRTWPEVLAKVTWKG